MALYQPPQDTEDWAFIYVHMWKIIKEKKNRLLYAAAQEKEPKGYLKTLHLNRKKSLKRPDSKQRHEQSDCKLFMTQGRKIEVK